jgi:phage terminase large subunit-like protein
MKVEARQYYKFISEVEGSNRYPKTIKNLVGMWRKNEAREDLYFDEKAVGTHLEFISLINLIDNEFAKKPIVIQDWQSFLISMIYGWKYVSTGNRKYKKVYLQIARKNSKTTTSSILSIDNAINDRVEGGQIIFAATTLEQAKLCFSMAQRMCTEMGTQYKGFKKSCSVWRGSVEFTNSHTIMKPVSADPQGTEGMGAKCAIVDELHVHPNDELLNSISKGMVSHANPLLIMITTAGYNKSDTAPAYQYYVYSKKILDGTMTDEVLLPMIWELDEEDDWKDENNWLKPNPNLGLSPKIEALREEFQTAINIGGAKEVDFKIKHLNMWVDSAVAWISKERFCDGQIETWPITISKIGVITNKGETLKGRAGLDLASVYDFCSLCIEVEYDGVYYVWWKYYLPEATVKNHPNEMYRVWAKAGYITVTPGNATDYNFIKRDITELFEQGIIDNVYYDRFNSSQLVIELTESGVPMVKMGQGFIDMSSPTKALEKSIIDGAVQHNNNPVSIWMMGNVAIKYNENYDQKISKKSSQGKVDGMVAWAMARKSNIDKLTEYTEAPSVWLI